MTGRWFPIAVSALAFATGAGSASSAEAGIFQFQVEVAGFTDVAGTFFADPHAFVMSIDIAPFATPPISGLPDSYFQGFYSADLVSHAPTPLDHIRALSGLPADAELKREAQLSVSMTMDEHGIHGYEGLDYYPSLVKETTLSSTTHRYQAFSLDLALDNNGIVPNIIPLHYDNLDDIFSRSPDYYFRVRSADLIVDCNPQCTQTGYLQEYIGRARYISTAAPEPSTWALMILGFASVGVVARRHPNKAA